MFLNKHLLIVCMGLAMLCGCARSPAAREAKYLASGKKYLAAKDYNRAILQFKTAVQAMPNDAEPHYQLALAALAAGDPRRSYLELKRATDLNPKHQAAQLKLAELLAESRSRDVVQDAQRRMQDLLKTSPGNPDALHTLAVTEIKLGQAESAAEHLEEALEKAPGQLKSSMALAMVELRNGNAAGAEETVKKAVRQSPKSPETAVVVGRYYLLTGKTPEAEAQFRRALALDPKYGPALLASGEVQLMGGRKDEAEKTFQRLSALPEPRFKPMHALFLLQEGKTESGITELKKLAEDDPKDRFLRTELVGVYLKNGRSADAQRILSQALDRNPKDVEALLQRSEISLQEGNVTLAEASLTKVLQFQPDSGQAHYAMARVNRARGLTETERTQLNDALKNNPGLLAARLRLSEILLNLRDPRGALDLLDHAPEAQKALLPYQARRNWVLLTLGDDATARQEINKSLAAARAPEFLLEDGLLKLRSHDQKGARASFEEALKGNPEYTPALDLLARTYLADKQTDAALRTVRDYAEKNPRSASTQMVLGQLLSATGKNADARAAFRQAKSIDPKNTAADLSLAILDIRENQFNSAKATLQPLLNSSNPPVSARLLMATSEDSAGNHAAAEQQYRKVLETEPTNALVMNNLAYLLAEHENKLDEAMGLAEEMLRIEPDRPAFQDTLGWIFYRKAMYHAALPYLERAVSKEGTARRRYHLAMTYFELGDQEKGKQMLKAAIALDSSLPEAKMAMQAQQQTQK